MEQTKTWRGSLLLLLTAMIWGAAFVAQSAGMDHIGPFTFNGLRMLLGALVLLPFLLVKRRRQAPGTRRQAPRAKRLLAGVLCGAALFAGSTLQQIGMTETTAGKAGFITAMYVVLVPLAGLALGHKQRALVWVSVALAAVGMYLLCAGGEAGVSRGDLLVFAGAVGFAVHILVIDHFSADVDGIELSCLQFFVSGVLGVVCMFLFEHPTLSGVADAWLPLAYAGVLSCGMGYTLQILGQRDVPPTVASLILCLESVFSVVFSWLLLHERLTARELFGCALILAGILLAQLKGEAKPADDAEKTPQKQARESA